MLKLMIIMNADIMALYWVVVYENPPFQGGVVHAAIPWGSKRPAELFCLQLRRQGFYGKIIKDYNYEKGDSSWGHWECNF